MKIIGLCGGSGAGKNEVCRYFAELGINSLDTDIVSRQVTEKGSKCLNELADIFSAEILTVNGELNRKKLADIVFSESEKLKRLNKITHKYILQKCEKFIEEERKKRKKFTIINAPLLFESGFNNRCDIKIAVIADAEIAVERIQQRDNLSKSVALRRVYSQKGREFLMFKADCTILNNSTPENLRKQVIEVYRKLEISIT